MKIEGTFQFAAPPERVWALLQDPDALVACIPGCESLTPDGEGEGRYVAAMSVGVAAFKGKYTGKVALANLDPPHHYDLQVEGSGRPGFVKGVGHISLAAEGDGTAVHVAGEAVVGGPVLSVGSRLVVPTAKLLMNQFFSAMQRRLESQAGP